MRSFLQEFTILYAEDEITLRTQVTEYLRGYFKEVYTASNGQEALELYKRYKPDVIMLDIYMPGINGLDVAKKIRQDDALTRIVMLTAHTEVEVLLQAAEIDMSRYLVKPIDPHEFKLLLDKLGLELAKSSVKTLRLDPVHIWEKETQTLIKHGEVVMLTEHERRLLHLLVQRRGTYASTEEIMANVWAESFDTEISRDSVKTLVNALRKKIPKSFIQSIYAIGYKLTV